MTVNNIIKPTPPNVKPAAIWARVSTKDQGETSLPSQVSRCREKLTQAGYSIIETFSVDWTSLDLYACPEFQQLRNLIRGRHISALAVYDRDRLEAKGLQRLIFLSELKEAGVELVICNGSPVIDGPEGQIVELALAIGKERQVMRARQGSKDGLHDRVKGGKPVTFRNPYGYTWDKANLKLIPNEDYETVKLIFSMLIDGSGYTPIIRELARRGIPSPSGKPEWGKVAISQITHNPVYAGRYFGLKSISTEPKNRRGNTYGNSSVKKLKLDDSLYLPNIEIVEPPITWQQRGAILDQLEHHQKLASRNAKRDYLLRGLLFCTEHRGGNGAPRRYHGQPHHGSFRYSCPVGQCYLNGPQTDYEFKYQAFRLLSHPETSAIIAAGQVVVKKTKAEATKELKTIGGKYDKCVMGLSVLEERYAKGEIIDDIYKITHERMTRELETLDKQRGQLLDEMRNIEIIGDTRGRIQKAFEKYVDRMSEIQYSLYQDGLAAFKVDQLPNFESHVVSTRENSPEMYREGATGLNNKQWREIIETMGLHALVTKGKLKFRIRVPIDADKLNDIASASPGLDLRNQTITLEMTGARGGGK